MKFRGHESFYIRKGWLQKGIKNILIEDRVFLDKDTNASDVLGIGVNMVKALRYWLNSTGLVSEEISSGDRRKYMQLTPFGSVINENDKFHEELGTNLLIHYKLSTNEEEATAWYWFFNIYDGSVIDKETFIMELNDYIQHEGEKKVSKKVLEDDYNCILKTYIQDEKEDNPEETKVCPLAVAQLLEISDKKTKEVRKVGLDIEDLHPMVAYAIIMDNAKGKKEISIDDILIKKENLGKVFNLSRTTIILILDKLSRLGYVKLERTAGLDIINIKKEMSFIKCVEEYYRMLSEGDSYES